MDFDLGIKLKRKKIEKKKKILFQTNTLLYLHEVVFPSLWQIQMESMLEHQEAIESLQEALQYKDITMDQMYVEIDDLHAEVANQTEHQVFWLRKWRITLLFIFFFFFSSSSFCLACVVMFVVLSILLISFLIFLLLLII